MVAVILILPNISLAQTGGMSSISTADLQAQIAALLAQIQALQTQISQQEPEKWCYDFKYNLNAQSRGKEVGQLQTALEKEGFEINSYEKTNQIFDESTADAVIGFQQKYKDEILNPYNLKYGTGFVGKSTRAKLNSLYGCGVIQPPPVSTTPSITVLSPNGGEVWEIGKSYYIRWKSLNLNSSDRIYIDIVPYDEVITGNRSNVVYQITSDITNSNDYYWIIPSDAKALIGSVYKIRVMTINGNVGDLSDTSFSIVAANTATQPILSISPTDIKITIGNNFLNTYQFTGAVSNAAPNSDVKLYLQRPNGTVKYENYYVGRTDSNGVLKVNTTQTIPNAYCCTYSAWVVVGGQKSNVVNINVTFATAQPSITILSPNSGEIWSKGTTQTIKWNSLNNNYVIVDLVQGINNTFIRSISTSISAAALQLSWQIPFDIPDGNDYKIRITNGTDSASNLYTYDYSDVSFSIMAPASSNPYITVVTPNGGEDLRIGNIHRIKWNSDLKIDKVSIMLTSDTNIGNWIVTNIANTGYYDWNVSKWNTNSTQFKIRIIVYQTGVGSWEDTSDNLFNIILGDIGATSAKTQVASILQSAEKILADMFNYLAR